MYNFLLILKLFNLKILTQRTYNRHFTSWLSLCVGCKMVCGDCNKCVNQIVIKRTAPYYMWSNINSLLERKGGFSSRVRWLHDGSALDVSAPDCSALLFQLQDFSAPRLFSSKTFQPQDFSAPKLFSS